MKNSNDTIWDQNLVLVHLCIPAWGTIYNKTVVNNPATEQHESNHKHENIKHQKGTLPKLTLRVDINVTTKTRAASTMHECTP
jgi:hypothetical protein